ncbi:unnamed protein product [Arctogadus glacialis]
MLMGPLWSVLLLLSIPEVCMQEVDYGDYEDPLCSTEETIRGGYVSYSQGGLYGSVLTYHCAHGYDPFPVSHRLCDDEGDWSTMTSANGRLVTRATCKERVCPGQLQLDNGDFWPRDQWFRPGTMQNFSCLGGLTLSGSASRTCTISLDWTGTSPICDNNVDACNDPGVPPGALRSGSRFQVGDTLTYRCQAGLDLLGSSQRVCLLSREWSGSAPRCQAYNGFDSPSTVAALMIGSLAGVIEALSPEIPPPQSVLQEGYGRMIIVEDHSRLNIYILLDTSGSLVKDFDTVRQSAISLIRKLDSFDVQMKFHVVSYASAAIDIVTIVDTFISADAQLVIEDIEKFNPKVHGDNIGTNLFAGLNRVNEMMALLKLGREDNHFMETQNVILIITDGNSNTGPEPQKALAQIRSHFGYGNTQNGHTLEELLDVYVFGVGKEINKKKLNDIASHKQNEEHIFILEDLQCLGEAFNQMIKIKTTTKCGVAQEELDRDDPKVNGQYTRPWHVALKILASDLSREEKCYGSVVSPNWILTAAHCFARHSVAVRTQKIEVTHGGKQQMMDGQIFIHPDFNIKGLQHRNVSEFYDFDVALVQLNSSVPLLSGARPVCLPCTTAADRAMKRVKSTCQQHRKELLPGNETNASFIDKTSKRVETLIHLAEQRQACVSKAAWELKDAHNVTLDELVPERFLCTGGPSRSGNPVSCKGDSGGSLFLKKRERYFQVGVLSWGTVDLCSGKGRGRPAADARDFHISLFTIVPWLKQHLGQELEFLPLGD